MIDFTKKIKNSNKFRQPAIRFQETGTYCSYPKGTSEYYNFWEQEMKYCIDGYTADDGDYITGYNYFYLNYCPIQRLVYTTDPITGETKKERIAAFPDFYDYDYFFFQAVQEAENKGKHLCLTKSRRKGYSYKTSSMLCRNFFLIPNSKSYVYASNKQFLTEDGNLTKAWDYMDFIDANTAWGKKRQVANTAMRKRASMLVTDEFGNKIEVGYKSEIMGVSVKDNPNSVRGKAAKLIVWEEGGSFKELKAAWEIARPSVEQDGIAFGTMILFGCVCKGSRVWTNEGNCINIEDIQHKDGILGWNTYQVCQQTIENINPPAKKPCVEISLRSGRTIRCSTDHPLLWSTPGRTRRVPGKRDENEHMKAWLWHHAGNCKVGDQVGLIDEIPIFGKKKMWEPRLVGWLIGDGNYGLDKTPRLFNCEEEILNYCHNNFDTTIEKEYITKSTNQLYQEIRIKGICKNLRELGIYGQTKDKKRLPVNFHEYDAESLEELLGGLYDTDGYVGINNTQACITLTQCQKEILLEVQEALLHFGIHGTINYIKPSNRNRKIKDVNGCWRLVISDVISLNRFAERIPLTVGKKIAALELIQLFTAAKTAKHHKYVSGIVADKIVDIKEIGEQDIYNLTAKEQHNYIVNGIVTHNTGGDQGENVAGLREAFYDPKKYNCIEFENIWDEGMQDRPCGFFVPQHTNLDVRDESGKRLYMDEDGNTLHEKAKQFILDLREEELKSTKSTQQIDRYVAEHAETPTEAFTELTGNIFPKKALQMQLSRIRTNKKLANAKQVGFLTEVRGEMVWNIQKSPNDITEYPLPVKADPTGAMVIWEHPLKEAPYGLYIAGIDPYDQDQSGTNSLGSCIIYKRFQNFESNQDIIVAEYTGRPKTAEDFYENVRKLLKYYNAKAMVENQNTGIFAYFNNKHCSYLLADQPDVIRDITNSSKVNRGKGCHMTKEIKAWGIDKIKEYLEEDIGNGKTRVDTILSEPLLEELIKYNDKANADRCMALLQVMIYKEQLYNHQVKKVEETEKKIRLFDKPIFKNYRDTFEPQINNSFSTTTFMYTN